jgi:uncharacterized protein (TIGR03067 family)
MKIRINRFAICGGFLAGATIFFCNELANVGLAVPPAPANSALSASTNAPIVDSEQLAGTWLFEDAQQSSSCQLANVWYSRVKIDNGMFSLSKFLGTSADLKGSFVLDAAANPKTVDLELEDCDLSKTSESSFKITAGLRRGIYQIEGDCLTICLNPQIDGPRPSTMNSTGELISRP